MIKEIIENLIETDGLQRKRCDVLSKRIDRLYDISQTRKSAIDALIDRIEKLEQRVKQLENE
jgi:polyhydroxyalkanoate synthesis regulator phasin